MIPGALILQKGPGAQDQSPPVQLLGSRGYAMSQNLFMTFSRVNDCLFI